jgi:tripartite-type tricarboxylate transporter receptor subunit TctC
MFAGLAQAWQPTKPISVVIGYPGGSQNELIFRKSSDIVVKNNPKIVFNTVYKPGVEGLLGINFLVTQPADGYNVIVTSMTGTVITNELWYNNLKHYSWQICPIPVILGETDMVVITTADSGINTFNDFLSLVKNTKENVNIATAGGTSSLAYSNLPLSDSVSEIKYKTSVEVAVAVAGKQTEFGITSLGVVGELAKNKKIKIIATSQERHPEFIVSNGFMLMLPPGTPMDTVQWYEKEFGKVLRDPDYQTWANDNYIKVNSNLATDKSTKEHLYAFKKLFGKTNANRK